MNNERKQAQEVYNQAVKLFEEASNGTNESVYLAADYALVQARKALVIAEEKHPTASEKRRTANNWRLHKMGFNQ